MRTLLCLTLTVAASLTAQVRYTPADHAITIDGKPFATFELGESAGKPFLAPLRSASGKIVTRRFPMEMVEGESRDHLHHRGLWFTYDDINGVKFWENDPSYKKEPKGRQVVRETAWKNGKGAGTLEAVLEWRGQEANVLLVEKRLMTFHADPKLRVIDFDITLTAATDVAIGDTKEGAFAIRLAEQFTERRGGKITDSEGRVGMKQVWGKRAAWVNYDAELEGEKLGVAIFDNPKNPRYPAYWHARDYGLFSLNPFGQNAFDANAPENIQKLKKDEQIHLKWRVVIHPADTDVAALYKAYTAGK